MKHLPIYKKIYHRLRKDIQDGVYQDGDKLPGEKQMMDEFSASSITIKHALSMLADDGLIKRTPGTGSFVTLTSAEDTELPRDSGFSVGVVMSGASDAFGSRFIHSVCVAARKRGCGMLLGIDYYSQQEETVIINQMIKNGARGIIIMPLHAKAYNVEFLRHAINGYPFVLADRYLEGLRVPYVGSGNEDAACEATRYLLSLGHKRIAYFSPMNTSTALSARRSGYIRAYAEDSLSLDTALILSSIQGSMPEFEKKGVREDINIIQQFMRAHPDVTAIVAADSPVAIIAEEALMQMGLSVPGDVSIVCFDAYDSHIKTSHFTHIRQNEDEMGRVSFQLLYDMITGQPVADSTLINTRLVLGRSSLPYIKK